MIYLPILHRYRTPRQSRLASFTAGFLAGAVCALFVWGLL